MSPGHDRPRDLRRPVVLFYWSWWLPVALRGQVTSAGVGWPTHLPGLVGPALAAVVVTLGWQGTGALRDLGRRAVRWRGVGRWWWSVPAVLALGAVGLAVSASARFGRRCSSPSPGAPGTCRCSGWSRVSCDGGASAGWALGLLAGSVVLTRLYVGSGRSVLLVALWHTAFSFTTATTSTQGVSAALASTAVTVAAVVVLVRARRRASHDTAGAQACAPTT